MVMSSAACTATAKRAWPPEGGATVKLIFAGRGHTERQRLLARLTASGALRRAARRSNFLAPGARSSGPLSRRHDRCLPE